MLRSVTLASFVVSLLAGCMGQLTARPGIAVPSPGVVIGGGEVVAGPAGPEAPAGPAGPEGAEGPAGPAYAPGEDRHWMQADDYFISEEPYVQGWMWIHLAKAKQAPTAESKGQGLFFAVKESRDIWTRNYWRTRPAEQKDLVLGAFAICFYDNDKNYLHLAPSTKRQARTGTWIFGKLTDVSDGYKRQVRVGTFDCALDAVRIAER